MKKFVFQIKYVFSILQLLEKVVKRFRYNIKMYIYSQNCRIRPGWISKYHGLNLPFLVPFLFLIVAILKTHI